jgi:hypothetical protein
MHDEVAEAVYNYYNAGQLKLKHLTQIFKRQYRSVFSYYKKYREAPRRAIRFIHDGEKAKLKSDEITLNEDLLQVLATEYQAQREGYSVNPQYIISDIVPRFLRARKLKEISDKLDTQIERGDIDNAEELLAEYEVVQAEAPDHTQGFLATLSYSYQMDFMKRKRLEGSKEVYRFDGALGAIIGPLKRQWLVSVSGTTKSGKSYFLLDLAIDATLFQKRKVMYFCPEMSEEDMNEERVVCYVANRAGTPEDAGTLWVPVFDCINNQTGKCTAMKRVKENGKIKRVPLRVGNGQLTKFTEHEEVMPGSQIDASGEAALRWNICTACRLLPERYSYSFYKKFRPSIYWKKKKVLPISDKARRRRFKGIESLPVNNLLIKYFPKYQMTIEQAFDVARKYVKVNDWKPDIIIFDYLDVLRASSGNIEMSWQDYDHLWKIASGFAQETDALIITADQTTKAGRVARLIDHTVTPQASTKDHHVDVKIGLNKFLEETLNNLCRVNVIYHRHKSFNRDLEIMLTQNLTLGKAMLDSALWNNKSTPPYPISMPEKIVLPF